MRGYQHTTPLMDNLITALRRIMLACTQDLKEHDTVSIVIETERRKVQRLRNKVERVGMSRYKMAKLHVCM